MLLLHRAGLKSHSLAAKAKLEALSKLDGDQPLEYSVPRGHGGEEKERKGMERRTPEEAEN